MISAERPDISEHNIDVSLGDALTIKGEKRSEREATDGDATYRERHFGWFLGRCGCPSTPATNALTPQRPVRVAKPAHLQRAVRSSAARTV